MAKETKQTSEELTIETLLAAAQPEQLLATVSFEKGMQLLEQLVAAVEKGQLPLEASIQSYERGAILVAKLREVLSGAEARLKVIKKS
jgi:exodeoxyribonuclease VII small subunit